MSTTLLRHREDIAAAVAAYNGDHPKEPLPHGTTRLLTVMFGEDDECHRSLEAIAAEGFPRKSLPGVLKRLVEAGFLSRHQASVRDPYAYRLHLPPVQP